MPWIDVDHIGIGGGEQLFTKPGPLLIDKTNFLTFQIKEAEATSLPVPLDLGRLGVVRFVHVKTTTQGKYFRFQIGHFGATGVENRHLRSKQGKPAPNSQHYWSVFLFANLDLGRQHLLVYEEAQCVHPTARSFLGDTNRLPRLRIQQIVGVGKFEEPNTFFDDDGRLAKERHAAKSTPFAAGRQCFLRFPRDRFPAPSRFSALAPAIGPKIAAITAAVETGASKGLVPIVVAFGAAFTGFADCTRFAPVTGPLGVADFDCRFTAFALLTLLDFFAAVARGPTSAFGALGEDDPDTGFFTAVGFAVLVCGEGRRFEIMVARAVMMLSPVCESPELSSFRP
jgi:hypothetical protein